MTKEQAEYAMLRAQAVAKRAMREAASQPNNEALWDIWQDAEKQAEKARTLWLSLKNQEMQEAA